MAAVQQDSRDIELEDGECSESDDEKGDGTLPSFTSTAVEPCQRVNAPSASYRSRIPQIVINSDESNDSDDDCPSMWKKSRAPASASQSRTFEGSNSDSPFVNPLLSNDSMSTDSFSAVKNSKRKNNIWGSVLTEQVLSHEIKSFGVNKPTVRMDTRDVESYDYTIAREDERPDLELDPSELNNSKDDIFGGVVDLETEVKRHENRKRKRNAKERTGKRTYNHQKTRNLGVTQNDDVPTVVKAITKALAEPKVDMFTRIVEAIGAEAAIRLYYMTEDLEEAGGMMTNDGYRRRTPGGVYIQLLKSDASISSDTINSIFEDEYLEWKKTLRERRKIKKAARRKWKRQAKREMDIDRPETPTPAEDLEVLNALDSNNEFDATDLPERPATPEPKDDSSDGEDEDDDEDYEEEDISVAIAKAKAAILKKQRELAGGIVGAAENAKDSEMGDDGDSSASITNKMSAQDLTSDVRPGSSEGEAGEMEDN